MVEKEELEIQKLQKEELEIQRLQAEIDEINFRIESEKNRIESAKKNSFRENIKSWATLIVVLTTISSAIVTLWIKSTNFLDQQAKRYEFILNQEMIVLVQQLSSEKSYEQDNAAILLSAFEKDAIPILLNHLDRADNPEATIRSLKLIKEKEKVGTNKVLDPLMKSAEEVFNREFSKSDLNTSSIKTIKNHIVALGELGKDKEEEIGILLKNLEEQTAKKQPPLRGSFKMIITSNINNALEQLGLI